MLTLMFRIAKTRRMLTLMSRRAETKAETTNEDT